MGTQRGDFEAEKIPVLFFVKTTSEQVPKPLG